ncbi:hypothetical protein SDC9_133028 [bioreactor metagenome]|uniref:Uncharacterized protein n=1 Tax=bioreactor metagenome TaxID=1076179 RepID=A0A645D9Q5_9ZZZZ
MDSLHLRFLTVKFLVNSLHRCKNVGIHIWFPSRISACKLNLCSGKVKYRLERACINIFCRINRASHKTFDIYLSVTTFNNRKIIGGFNQTRHSVTHTLHSVRASIDRLHSLCCNNRIDCFGRFLGSFNLHIEGWLVGRKLRFHLIEMFADNLLGYRDL